MTRTEDRYRGELARSSLSVNRGACPNIRTEDPMEEELRLSMIKTLGALRALVVKELGVYVYHDAPGPLQKKVRDEIVMIDSLTAQLQNEGRASSGSSSDRSTAAAQRSGNGNPAASHRLPNSLH